ncbi:MAG: DeoR family transcriptional regulator [Candidatus Gribaldobacteria bacterium]|nr:DeoR family transcriptional regulator [Candidatus Gribaldobacteria bacterium]
MKGGNMMDKSHFIKLTIGVYKVSELFPKREPLKFLLRRKADEVLASLVVAQFQPRALEQALEQIVVLGVYFQIAESQNWVKPENFWLLKTEYLVIEKEVKQMLVAGKQANGQPKPKSEPVQPSKPRSEVVKIKIAPDFSGLKDRHKKIIQVLRQKASAQIRDFNKVLPEVTKRTLRRDLDFLLHQGLVTRFGDKSKTEYKIKV